MWTRLCRFKKASTALTNLPKPMTANNYDKIVNRLNNVAKEVVNETMKDASEDLLSKIKDPNGDIVIDSAVSCDGKWQKRGYSSLNGVVTVISMDNGKILDVEPMTRTCKSCLLHEKSKLLTENVLKSRNWHMYAK